ncbi:MFS transporter [Corynebacterium aquatimens]
MVALDNSILYTALPALNAQLDASPLQSLWIINAYPLLITGLLLGTGTLGDRIGHKKMFVAGLLIFGAASLAAAFAPSPWALVAARGVLGIGAAAMMPATLALINQIFTEERERNIAIGIWASAAVVGAAIGPVVGGLLLEYFWWGSVFFINVPIVLVALAGTFLLGPPNHPNPAKQWDATSSLYALIALSGLTMVIKQVTHPGANLPLIIAALVCAVIGTIAFHRRQKKLTDPLLTFDIFRNRVFAGGVLAAIGAMFVLIGMELTSTQRLQLVHGFTPFHAGLATGAVAVVAFPFSIAGGALLERIGFLTITGSGFTVSVLGAALSWWGSHSGSFAVLLSGFLLIGAGTSFIMSVSSIAIIGAAPPERAGMAAGVEEVSYEFGTLITVAVTGSLLPAVYASLLPPELQAKGMDAMYDPTTNPLAAPAYTSAHETVILFLAVTAAIFGVVTAWCFRDNPTSPVQETHHA